MRRVRVFAGVLSCTSEHGRTEPFVRRRGAAEAQAVHGLARFPRVFELPWLHRPCLRCCSRRVRGETASLAAKPPPAGIVKARAIGLPASLPRGRPGDGGTGRRRRSGADRDHQRRRRAYKERRPHPHAGKRQHLFRGDLDSVRHPRAIRQRRDCEFQPRRRRRHVRHFRRDTGERQYPEPRRRRHGERSAPRTSRSRTPTTPSPASSAARAVSPSAAARRLCPVATTTAARRRSGTAACCAPARRTRSAPPRRSISLIPAARSI